MIKMSMKTIKLFLGYLIAIIMLYSCIDDEGNYDYTELKTVVISNVSSIGQPLWVKNMLLPRLLIMEVQILPNLFMHG